MWITVGYVVSFKILVLSSFWLLLRTRKAIGAALLVIAAVLLSIGTFLCVYMCRVAYQQSANNTPPGDSNRVSDHFSDFMTIYFKNSFK